MESLLAADKSAEPLVKAEKLTKAYGPTVAVNAVSFSIRRGTITALLGGNGAGKSSLTRLVSGGVRPDEGTLLFDSQSVSLADYTVRKAKEAGIRVVHQEFSVCRGVSAQGAQARRGAKVLPGWLMPLAALVIVLAAIGIFNSNALTPFGLGLLLSTALPLVLVSYAQMFVVGRSEIDLGVGAFAGLTNVVSATWLVEKPLLGVVALAAGLVLYGFLGWVIHVRKIPALVATLGSAFVWSGLGYVLQPAPGGSSPEWLSAIFNFAIPFIPVPVWILILASLLALLLVRSRLGIVQRGFGNNEAAMRELGWPALRSHILTYVLSGVFGLLAGLCLTGVNTASDVNAASSYTLLSVAAVVMGGCDLVGGRIEPIGVALAAVTLSLLGALLGFMKLSSDNIAAVQGLILIGIVILRSLWGRAR
jgi:ribose transport system ATP-binding protein